MYSILRQSLIKFLRWWTNICSIPVLQYKRNHDDCLNIKEYRKRKLHRHTWNGSDPL